MHMVEARAGAGLYSVYIFLLKKSATCNKQANLGNRGDIFFDFQIFNEALIIMYVLLI